MSVDARTAFLDRMRDDPEFGTFLRAMTDELELVALAHRSGYTFEVEDLATASSVPPATTTTLPPVRLVDGDTSIGHYELELARIPELRPLLEELPNLTIQPDTVDLERFAAAFRPDDLEWTSMSPLDAGFRERYEEIKASERGAAAGASRRGFHLVGLDERVDYPSYERYFEAKVRTLRHLERLFGCEIRFSGSMWYPPFAYRLWHTNENQPGWRMYLIDFDEDVAESDERSFFRYMNPRSKELVTLRDRPKLLRFFKVDQHPGRLFWHCIVNGAERNRWSFGFAIPDDWMDRLGASISLDALQRGPSG